MELKYKAYKENGAIFSSCKNYRYLLWRKLSDANLSLTFIMLNPSIADHRLNDNTVKKCMKYASKWGYGRLVIVNLFGYISTSPEELRTSQNPIGRYNDFFIKQAVSASSFIVCAWGNNGKIRNRDLDVLALLNKYEKKVAVFGLTKQGRPMHPLYLSQMAKPKLINLTELIG